MFIYTHVVKQEKKFGGGDKTMYKCVNCGAIKKEGDDVYFIESAFFNDIFPTCSEKCAKELKNRELKKLKDKLNKI